MPSASLWLKLLGTPSEFEKFIQSALSDRFDKVINKSINLIKEGIVPIINLAISNCPEMEALQSDQFRGEIGLSSGKAAKAIDAIAEAVSGSVVVENTSSAAAK